MDTTYSNSLTNTCVLDASQKQVFEAFSDPKHLAQWWGPKGFTNKFEVFDFRPGGYWRFTMAGPDGNSYSINKQFIEIVAPNKIVLLNLQQEHKFIMTISLTPQRDKTKMTWDMTFESAEEFAKVKEFILKANEENFERLQEHLKRQSPTKQAL